MIDEEADMPGVGPVRFDKDAIANVLSLNLMGQKYRITMDTAKENAFIVETDNGKVKFKANEEGLYVCRPTEDFYEKVAESKKKSKIAGVSQLATVEMNKEGFTDRQIKRAERARELYHCVGAPTWRNFKYMLRQNLLKNCPVTVEDINIAEKIFGPDTSTLKGKSTRRKPKVVVDDYIEIPPELIENSADIVLCMDIMYVNKQAIMTAIDKPVRYRSAVPLSANTKEEAYRGLDNIFRLYNGTGRIIKRVECDREFRPIMDEVKDDLDVVMNYTNTGEHQSEAERNNRVIRERESELHIIGCRTRHGQDH